MSKSRSDPRKGTSNGGDDDVEVDHTVDFSGVDFDALVQGHAHDSVGDRWQDLDAFGGYVDRGSFSLADPFVEDDSDVSLDGASQSLFTAKANLSFAQRKRLARGRDAVGQFKDRVDESWFEDDEPREAFCIIRDHALNLQLSRAELPKDKLRYRLDALRFFFGAQNLQHIGLDDCCAAIDHSVRPDVVRLRLNYEFYLRWLRIPRLADDCVELPTIVLSRLAFQQRAENDIALLDAIWRSPGVMVEEAMVAATNEARHRERLRTALAHWEQEGLVSNQTGHLYLTGRNPQADAERRFVPGLELRARPAQISWSRLF